MVSALRRSGAEGVNGLALAWLAIGVADLIVLSAIDLRTRLLPNPFVLLLAAAGIIFHLATQFRFLPLFAMVEGGLYGFFSLFTLRAVANHLAQADTLGLGDVKLMGAGGLWLGPSGIMAAMAAGAAISLAAGFGFTLYKRLTTGERIPLGNFTLPAGPGFALGMALTGFICWQRGAA